MLKEGLDIRMAGPLLGIAGLLVVMIAAGWGNVAMAASYTAIDDLSRAAPQAIFDADWRFVGGGVLTDVMRREAALGRPAIRFEGEVRLEKNGGFIQLVINLDDVEKSDASGWDGIEIEAHGNGEACNLHLSTDDMRLPCQFYRQQILAAAAWRTIQLPFDSFKSHRIDAPLDARKPRRLGVVTIGRKFRADIAIGSLRLYKSWNLPGMGVANLT
mgnify:CR=1 FL=1